MRISQVLDTATISACMIVKDEAHNLDRCLSSIRNYVDEIIVVDTGSTDDTVETARKYTDKIFYYEWDNNFSNARNESLKYAKNEWVLVIDADEELKFNKTNLKQEIIKAVNQGYDGISFVCVDIQGGIERSRSGTNVRVFRREGAKYTFAVHNQLIGYSKQKFCNDIELFHYGYDIRTERRQARLQQSKAILVEEYNKNDWKKPYFAYHLGLITFSENEFETAYNYFKEAMADEKVLRQDTKMTICFHLAHLSAIMGREQEAEDWCYEGLKKDPTNYDFFHILASIAYKDKDFKACKVFAQDYLYNFLGTKIESEYTYYTRQYFDINMYRYMYSMAQTGFYEDDLEFLEQHIDRDKNKDCAELLDRLKQFVREV